MYGGVWIHLKGGFLLVYILSSLPGSGCSKLMMSLVNEILKFLA